MTSTQFKTKVPRFFADLKRRRVFQVMAVYGAVSLASLEGLSLLQPVLLLPDWSSRVAGFIALSGFPFSVYLTWYFDYDDHLVVTSPATPEELDEIIRKPRLRRWATGTFALAGLFFVGSTGWYALTPPTVPSSIAVLPFIQRTELPGDAFFAEGLQDDILVHMSRDPSLRVVSRTSVQRFRGSALPLGAMADSLNVRYVLEGAVQRSGDTVHVTIQIIRGDDDSHAWAGTWDVVLAPTSTLLVQRQIAEDIAEVVRQLGTVRAM